nr:MAG TPA: hypothetical protein [Caudoviricetes sp.]DAT51880.1 MAG TPA: hypothetical protein [Caudoviricetes sp.]
MILGLFIGKSPFRGNLFLLSSISTGGIMPKWSAVRKNIFSGYKTATGEVI